MPVRICGGVLEVAARDRPHDPEAHRGQHGEHDDGDRRRRRPSSDTSAAAAAPIANGARKKLRFATSADREHDRGDRARAPRRPLNAEVTRVPSGETVREAVAVTGLDERRAKSSASNGRRSSSASPMPMSFTGMPSSPAIASAMPPFAVPSSFVSTMPSTGHGLGEELGLAQAVLAGRRVDREQRLVRRVGQLLVDHAADLRELGHQVVLGVQAPGGVDDDHVDAALAALADRLEGDRARVGALAGP